jgi:hypothetical protein
VVVGVVAALVLTLALSGGGSSRSNPTAISSTAGGAACTSDTRSDPGRSHVQNPTYTVNPPAGGDHYPVPASAGVYTANPPPDSQLVHSLEHGYVILWFDPTTESADLQKIVAAAQKYPADTLVVPRSGMPVPLAATAWHHRLLCQGFNEGALLNFIAQYRNQGPEKIPHT